MSQEYSYGERIHFLLVHMMQMELLLVLLGTAVAAWLLAIALRKKNARLAEQLLSRKIAILYAGLLVLIWLSGHLAR
ncbi:hypothetical protein [Sporomusa aerivorans]|uniref:hypothetical protein n=1 Tax=Sporomusa aerivorans TaxID=204936 RepID=UPI00352A3954